MGRTAIAVLAVPYPPSVNRIWRSRRGAGGKPSFFLDRRYQTWKRVFDNIVMAERPRPKVVGHFCASITLDHSKRRSNTDADNRAKVILDALQRCGIIENDSLADRVTVQWGVAPEGARVTVIPSLEPGNAALDRHRQGEMA